jgi:hypothetical protein
VFNFYLQDELSRRYSTVGQLKTHAHLHLNSDAVKRLQCREAFMHNLFVVRVLLPLIYAIAA